MKIKILNKEYPEYRELKSGLSVYIEHSEARILFDTSFARDIEKVKFPKTDFIVISHGHLDHTDGLRVLDLSKFKTLVAHPGIFKKRFYEGMYIGCPVLKEYLATNLEMMLSKKPLFISDNIAFLGEIKRRLKTKGAPVGVLENGKPDYINDDSAIGINTKEGVVVVTGCSHSGVVNIVDQAAEVFGKDVFMVVGGMHIFDRGTAETTISELKERNIKHIFPMHCLYETAFKIFEKNGARRLRTNNTIVFNRGKVRIK